MRRFLLLSVLGYSFMLLTFVANGQELTYADIPQKVQNHFNATFPEAQQPKWKKTKKGKFEAAFIQDGRKIQVKYLDNGEWHSTEKRLERDELPSEVIKYIEEHYPKYTIVKMEFQDRREKGKDIFKVNLIQEKNEAKLKFDIAGKIKEKTEVIDNRLYKSVY